MRFSEGIQQLLLQVEKTSGRKIFLSATPDTFQPPRILKSCLRPNAYVLEYDPALLVGSYPFATQLAGLIRFLSLPQNDRWSIVSTSAEKKNGLCAIGLKSDRSKYALMLLEIAVTKMRDTCIGLRVDSWIYAKSPELRESLISEIGKEFWEDEIKRLTSTGAMDDFPQEWITLYNSIRAARAIWRARLIGEPDSALPYTSQGYGEIAGKLVDALDELTDEPSGDKALVERWSNILGLSGAFHFIPHDLLDVWPTFEDCSKSRTDRLRDLVEKGSAYSMPVPKYEGPKLAIVYDDMWVSGVESLLSPAVELVISFE